MKLRSLKGKSPLLYICRRPGSTVVMEPTQLASHVPQSAAVIKGDCSIVLSDRPGQH